MKCKIESLPLSGLKSDVVVLGVFLSEPVADAVAQVDKAFAHKNAEFVARLASAAKEEGFSGKPGQVVALPTYEQAGFKRLFLVGLGKQAEFDESVSRKIGANMARRLSGNSQQTAGRVAIVCRLNGASQAKTGSSAKGKSPARAVSAAHSAASLPAQSLGTHVRALVEGFGLGAYSFQKYKSSKEKKDRTIELSVLVAESGRRQKAARSELNHQKIVGEAVSRATNFARALIAEPASYMTPTRLAEEARQIAKQHQLTVKVLDRQQVEKLNMGAFLGVARGAAEPLRLIVIRYESPKAKKTVALVGKGITFDSGGLSLKTPQGMEHMKYDMSGAAIVLAAMDVIGQLKPKTSVMAVIAATENMPGSAALHPGDVLHSMNGKTIEVNNTDAEGRLILADALTYACRNGADELIDVATLTGAVVTALGRVAAGIMGSDQRLVDRLISSGKAAGEKLWQLPLYDEYKDGLKSDIADLKNAGSRGEAATSSAAMFLKEFVEGKPWAHLDIAGPGWLDKDRDENNRGGTAFGVRTLCQYILTE